MKTASGLIITGSAPVIKYGKIIAKGPGKYKNGKIQRINLKVGSYVWLPDFGGTKIKLNKRTFYMYKDSDILGTLKEWWKH